MVPSNGWTVRCRMRPEWAGAEWIRSGREGELLGACECTAVDAGTGARGIHRCGDMRQRPAEIALQLVSGRSGGVAGQQIRTGARRSPADVRRASTYVVDIQAAAAATPSTSLSRRRKACPARLDWPTWNRRSTSSAPRVYSTQTRCRTKPPARLGFCAACSYFSQATPSSSRSRLVEYPGSPL